MRNNSKSRQNEAPQQTLRERAAQTRDAAGRFLTRAGDTDAPQVQLARLEPSLGTIPASSNASPDAYGLQIDANGFGLHAAPGASVLVEPEMPTKAGLAVFYMRGGRGPAIFDLTRDFHPEFARPFSSGSEVMPLIEVVDPVTGEFGRMRADQVGTIHRITGIFTPADIMAEHLFCPTRFPEMDVCPESMGDHYVEGAAAYATRSLRTLIAVGRGPIPRTASGVPAMPPMPVCAIMIRLASPGPRASPDRSV